MREEVPLGNARPDEWAEISALVSSSGLPLDGLRETLDTVLVARDGERILGVVALELYGSDALLRSLAVARERRGGGLGIGSPGPPSISRGNAALPPSIS